MNPLMAVLHYYFTRFANMGRNEPHYYVLLISLLVVMVLLLSRLTLHAS